MCNVHEIVSEKSFLSNETYDGHDSIYVKYLNAWGDLIYRMQVQCWWPLL